MLFLGRSLQNGQFGWAEKHHDGSEFGGSLLNGFCGRGWVSLSFVSYLAAPPPIALRTLQVHPEGCMGITRIARYATGAEALVNFASSQIGLRSLGPEAACEPVQHTFFPPKPALLPISKNRRTKYILLVCTHSG